MADGMNKMAKVIRDGPGEERVACGQAGRLLAQQDLPQGANAGLTPDLHTVVEALEVEQRWPAGRHSDTT